MASFRRQKEALRIAIFAYFAGAHFVTEEVEKAQSLSPTGGRQGASDEEITEMRHAMLEADYERLRGSIQAIDMLAEILEEEDLYPYGSEWPREALGILASKLIPPKLSSEASGENDFRFRFKKGFKELLNEIAEGVEGSGRKSSTLDHWMVLLLNAAFHAGAVIAARNAENPKLYYNVMPNLEEETDPWSKYPQLSDLLDKQMQRETRRKSGLVTDLDYEY